MDDIDFLDITLEISKQDNLKEAELRNVIGRLHDYCYHEAKSFILANEEYCEFSEQALLNNSAHKSIFNTFYQYSKSTRDLRYGIIWRLLKDIHTERCDADYELNINSKKSALISLIKILVEIKNNIDELKLSFFQIDVDEFIPKKVDVRKRKIRILEN